MVKKIEECNGLCDTCANSCGDIKDRMEEFQMLVAMNVCTGNCDKCGIPCVNNNNPELRLENHNKESKELAENRLEEFNTNKGDFTLSSISEFLNNEDNTEDNVTENNFILKENRNTSPIMNFNIKDMMIKDCEDTQCHNCNKECHSKEQDNLISDIENRHTIIYDNHIQNNMYYKHNTKNGVSEMKYEEGYHPDDEIHNFVTKILFEVDKEMYEGIY